MDRVLAPAETVRINYDSYELEILNRDYSLKRRQIVSRQTVWRLVKMWAKTPEEWRSLEWNRKGECIGQFRHSRKIDLQQSMTLKEYLQQENIRRGYERH